MFEFNRNKPTCVLIAQETNSSVLVNRWTGNTKLLSLLGVGKVLQTEHPRANCFFTSSVLTGSPVCLGCCKLEHGVGDSPTSLPTKAASFMGWTTLA